MSFAISDLSSEQKRGQAHLPDPETLLVVLQSYVESLSIGYQSLSIEYQRLK
jgi:hypothetical protein